MGSSGLGDLDDLSAYEGFDPGRDLEWVREQLDLWPLLEPPKDPPKP